MMPEDHDLRRALDARSGAPSPDLQGRLEKAFEMDPPRPNITAAIAIVTVLAISIGSIGALIASRHNRPVANVSSGPRLSSPEPTSSPTPLYLPGEAQVVAPSTNVVWMLVDYQALFLSTDQGNTWQRRLLPNPFGGIRPVISFINDREGWLLAPGSPATQCEEATADVWHTTDGAATWQQLAATGVSKSQCKGGIWFVDSSDGFMSAADPNHRPVVYRTSDGGSTWTAATLADPPDFQTVGAGVALHVEWIKRLGATYYLEAADGQNDPPSSHQYIYTSSDGATWTWREKIPSRDVVMVTESRWLILTGQPQETLNGGQQWHPFVTDFNLGSPVFSGEEFVFADGQTGYESRGGVLQRTTDGGTDWTQIQTPTSAVASPSPTPSGIPMPTTTVLSAPSTNVVWALVAGYYLFRSTDEGQAWERREMPNRGSGAAISFVDANTGWALFTGPAETSCTGQSAELWETTDGAKTWHDAAADTANGFPHAQCKDALYFADAKHGWLATGDTVEAPHVYRTSDGGVTWSDAALEDPRLTPINAPALRVESLKAFGSTLLAYAPQFVFRSSDGGAHWTYVASSSSPVFELAFVTVSRWIQLIPPGQSAETTDGGQTWHAFVTDYQQAAPVAPVVVFADSEVGYATVRGGIQHTQDGGGHWVYLQTPGTLQPG